MSIFMLILGIGLLVLGANWFVESSVSIAKKFKIPSIVIGLTLVAFGTSAPEAAVSISSAVKQNSDIAFANVLGSNLFNILFILGITAMIQPIKIQKMSIKKELPFMLFTTAIAIFLIWDSSSVFLISKADGWILMILFLMYLYAMLEIIESQKEKLSLPAKNLSSGKGFIYLILGLSSIVLGAELTVKGAISIAKLLHISDMIIGLTIVAVGTSLPELVTSIVAAIKKESDIAVGNIIGSNIFNLLFILGASSAIHPIKLLKSSLFDTFMLLLVSLITSILMFTEYKISRKEGFFLTLTYLTYILIIIIKAI
ncbi:MAG: calcium/sodium antiporter [Clostridia bacterium]|nr:calcium/sodium antiporter [Clostridia bacterium]